VGWSRNANAANPEFHNTQAVNNLAAAGGSVTLFAIWRNRFTVQYQLNHSGVNYLQNSCFNAYLEDDGSFNPNGRGARLGELYSAVGPYSLSVRTSPLPNTAFNQANPQRPARALRIDPHNRPGDGLVSMVTHTNPNFHNGGGAPGDHSSDAGKVYLLQFWSISGAANVGMYVWWRGNSQPATANVRTSATPNTWVRHNILLPKDAFSHNDLQIRLGASQVVHIAEPMLVDWISQERTPQPTIFIPENQGIWQVQTVDSGARFNPPTPTRAGYTFAGWWTRKFESAHQVTYATNMYAGNVTLYARWTPVGNFNVSFNANGGSGSMSNQTIARDADVALAGNTFTRAGYRFLGWSTAQNATTATFANGATVRNLAAANATVTLFAVWEREVVVTHGIRRFVNHSRFNYIQNTCFTLSVEGGGGAPGAATHVRGLRAYNGIFSGHGTYSDAAPHTNRIQIDRRPDTGAGLDRPLAWSDNGTIRFEAPVPGSAQNFFRIATHTNPGSVPGEAGRQYLLQFWSRANVQRVGIHMWWDGDEPRQVAVTNNTAPFTPGTWVRHNIILTKTPNSGVYLNLHFSNQSQGAANYTGVVVNLAEIMLVDSIPGVTNVDNAFGFFNEFGQPTGFVPEFTGNIGTMNFPAGGTYDIPEPPARAGYNFIGWFDRKIGGNQITDSTPVIPTTVHLFAQWEPLEAGIFTQDIVTTRSTHFFDWGDRNSAVTPLAGSNLVLDARPTTLSNGLPFSGSRHRMFFLTFDLSEFADNIDYIEDIRLVTHTTGDGGANTSASEFNVYLFTPQMANHIIEGRIPTNGAALDLGFYGFRQNAIWQHRGGLLVNTTYESPDILPQIREYLQQNPGATTIAMKVRGTNGLASFLSPAHSDYDNQGRPLQQHLRITSRW